MAKSKKPFPPGRENLTRPARDGEDYLQCLSRGLIFMADGLDSMISGLGNPTLPAGAHDLLEDVLVVIWNARIVAGKLSADRQEEAMKTVWIKWWIGDHLKDTMHLSTEEHGAYMLLVFNYYARQGPLPDDDRALANICRTTARTWARMRPTLQALFRPRDGLWHHKRIDAELAGNAARTNQSRQAASTRWRNGRDSRRNATACDPHMPDPCSPDADSNATACDPHMRVRSQSQKSEKYPPLPPSSVPASGPSGTPDGGGGDEDRNGFETVQDAERIWRIWPKKVHTMPALIAIRHAIARHGFERVLEGTLAVVQANAIRQDVPPGRYLPSPERFFDDSCYLDDPTQYGPRVGALDEGEVRRVLAEKLREKAEHPGNPENGIGSLERKEAARPDFERLCDEIADLRRRLGGREGGGE